MGSTNRGAAQQGRRQQSPGKLLLLPGNLQSARRRLVRDTRLLQHVKPLLGRRTIGVLQDISVISIVHPICLDFQLIDLFIFFFIDKLKDFLLTHTCQAGLTAQEGNFGQFDLQPLVTHHPLCQGSGLENTGLGIECWHKIVLVGLQRHL